MMHPISLDGPVERLPDAEMAKMRAEASSILSVCVTAMRAFFQERRRPPTRRSAKRPKRKQRG